MNRGIHTLLLAATASAVLVAGCGGSNNNASKKTSSTTSSSSSTQSSASTTSTTSAQKSSSAAQSTTGLPTGGSGAAIAAYCETALANAKSRLTSAETSQFESYCASLAHDNASQIKTAEKTLCTEIVKDTVPSTAQTEALAVCAKL